MTFKIFSKVRVLKEFEGADQLVFQIGKVIDVQPNVYIHQVLVEFTEPHHKCWWFPMKGYLEIIDEKPDDGLDNWI